MGKENRRNRDVFIKIEIALLAALAVFAAAYFFYAGKVSEASAVRNALSVEYSELQNDIRAKEEEISALEAERESYVEIDERLSAAEKDYYNTIKTLEDEILSGKSEAKIAYLTFDDGPYYNTYKVMDILDEYGVKACFFTTSINGTMCYDKKGVSSLPLYQEYVKRGHTIGNHTFTHATRKGLYASVDAFMDSVIRQEERIKEQTGGYVTNILRFPGGVGQTKSLKADIIAALKERGYGWVQWTALDGDGAHIGTQEAAFEQFKNTINEGIEVILLHDYSRITTPLLPDMIKYLRENGYILLPLFYESNMVHK